MKTLKDREEVEAHSVFKQNFEGFKRTAEESI